MTQESKRAGPAPRTSRMQQQMRERVARLRLYRRGIALLGLASSIVAGNNDGLFGSISIPQKKVVLVFASAMLLQSVYRRIRRPDHRA